MPDSLPRILLVAGARPNFMKVAPLLRALRDTGACQPLLVHTGQHFSPEMSEVFFRDLQLPPPDIHLAAGSGSQAQQTADIMVRFEPVLDQVRPDWVVVVGDVNSTVACALVAKKLHYRLAHVEAGLRSFDRRMPEEINRLVTDSISDCCFTTEPSANLNLQREGMPAERIHYVGNLMIDTLVACRPHNRGPVLLPRLKVRPQQYVVITLHRPENVDDPGALLQLWRAIVVIAGEWPVVFPVHPRTAQRLRDAALTHPRILQTEPLGYLDFLGLLDGARAVLTDSGGVQEETTILGIPCLTLRENTERPITLTHGTNRLAGVTTDSIVAAWHARAATLPAAPPPLWDGQTASRIAAILVPGLTG